jgi:hypothetical protein
VVLSTTHIADIWNDQFIIIRFLQKRKQKPASGRANDRRDAQSSGSEPQIRLWPRRRRQPPLQRVGLRFPEGEICRIISVLLAWYPRLLHGSEEERSNWRLIGDGEGIYWPDLEEDISVEHLLLGIPSRERQASLKRWLEKCSPPKED